MLPKVSRTFAICIRLLPDDLEHPVLVAYLLCRIADTIEDTTTLQAADKERLLEDFRRCLETEGGEATPLRTAFARAQNDDAVLAREADAVLREFRLLPASQQNAIRPWVQEMSAGMAMFARRKEDGQAAHIEALRTVEDLDRYFYYVAGTVGHMLTELFRLRSRDGEHERYRTLERLATSFGLGLQLTNIIKDVADDRERGWSFVPQELCQLVGIETAHLHDGQHGEAALQVMHRLIAKTKHHLNDALTYITTLPRREYGIRLFCLTALYFAVQTLELAERDDRLLDPDHKVKISRADVARTIGVTRVVAPSNTLVRFYFQSLAGRGWPAGSAPASPS
jgi:farnesyl-diphosphate farnesyltransferase